MAPPNVFLLTVDSLRYDYFADYQEELADSTDGVEFTDAVPTATMTSSSMPALATGKFEDEIDAWGIPDEGDPKPLAESLSEQGYTGGLWSDNYLFGVEYNYDRGFEAGDVGTPTWKKRISNTLRESALSPLFPVAEWTFFNVYQPVANTLGGEDTFYRSAEDLHESVYDELDDMDDPVFCWIHYMDLHHPFEPPEDYIKEYTFNTQRSRSGLGEFTRNVISDNGEGYSEAEIEDVRTAYEATVEYTGDEITAFIDDLRSTGHFDPDRDVLALTADHGEGLSPDRYDMMGHVPPAPWEEMIRVPLVISAPDWESDTVDEQASLSHLHDTILGLVDESVDDGPTPSDLTTREARFVTKYDSPGQDVALYRGLRDASGTKIFGAPRDGDEKIVMAEYDRETLVDTILQDVPEDEADAVDDDSFQTLRRRAEEYGRLVDIPESTTMDLDEEHLRDLGYLE